MSSLPSVGNSRLLEARSSHTNHVLLRKRFTSYKYAYLASCVIFLSRFCVISLFMIAMRLLVEADTSCDINVSLLAVSLFIYIHINVGVSVIAIYFRNSSKITRWGLGLLSAVIMSGFKTAFLLRKLFPRNDTTIDPSLLII